MAKKKITLGVATVKMNLVSTRGKLRKTLSDKVGFVSTCFNEKYKEELGLALQKCYKLQVEDMNEGNIFDKVTVTVTFETLQCNQLLNDD